MRTSALERPEAPLASAVFSSTTTRLTAADVSAKAMLVPITPPPITITSAVSRTPHTVGRSAATVNAGSRSNVGSRSNEPLSVATIVLTHTTSCADRISHQGDFDGELGQHGRAARRAQRGQGANGGGHGRRLLEAARAAGTLGTDRLAGVRR